jgi:hypothetical protein
LFKRRVSGFPSLRKLDFALASDQGPDSIMALLVFAKRVDRGQALLKKQLRQAYPGMWIEVPPSAAMVCPVI